MIEPEEDRKIRQRDEANTLLNIYIHKNSQTLGIYDLPDFYKFKEVGKPLKGQIVARSGSVNNAEAAMFSYISSNGEEKSIPVVWKGFSGFEAIPEERKFASELAAYRRIGEANRAGSNIPQLKPIFFIDAQSKYFATEAKNNLLSIEKSVFNEKTRSIALGEDFSDVRPELYRLWARQGAISFLRLHCIGIKHGDPRIRNISIETLSGTEYLMDYELGEVNDRPLSIEESIKEINAFLVDLAYSSINLDDSDLRDFQEINIEVLTCILGLYQEDQLPKGEWTNDDEKRVRELIWEKEADDIKVEGRRRIIQAMKLKKKPGF